MPLPEQVVEQLGNVAPSDSQGWAYGALLFSGGVLFLAVAIYAGLAFGYQPYLNSQIASAQDQAKAAGAQVTATQQQEIISFYSQISNVKTILANHVYVSQFLSWLEKNTEANVYYESLQLNTGDRVILKGNAKTEADVNQQIAIFENSPQVQNVALSGVNVAQTGSGFEFNVTLTMNPSVFSNTSL